MEGFTIRIMIITKLMRYTLLNNKDTARVERGLSNESKLVHLEETWRMRNPSLEVLHRIFNIAATNCGDAFPPPASINTLDIDCNTYSGEYLQICKATAPATCGAACDVPDTILLASFDPIQADVMPKPGA